MPFQSHFEGKSKSTTEVDSSAQIRCTLRIFMLSSEKKHDGVGGLTYLEAISRHKESQDLCTPLISSILRA